MEDNEILKALKENRGEGTAEEDIRRLIETLDDDDDEIVGRTYAISCSYIKNRVEDILELVESDKKTMLTKICEALKGFKKRIVDTSRSARDGEAQVRFLEEFCGLPINEQLDELKPKESK